MKKTSILLFLVLVILPVSAWGEWDRRPSDGGTYHTNPASPGGSSGRLMPPPQGPSPKEQNAIRERQRDLWMEQWDNKAIQWDQEGVAAFNKGDYAVALQRWYATKEVFRYGASRFNQTANGVRWQEAVMANLELARVHVSIAWIASHEHDERENYNWSIRRIRSIDSAYVPLPPVETLAEAQTLRRLFVFAHDTADDYRKGPLSAVEKLERHRNILERMRAFAYSVALQNSLWQVLAGMVKGIKLEFGGNPIFNVEAFHRLVTMYQQHNISAGGFFAALPHIAAALGSIDPNATDKWKTVNQQLVCDYSDHTFQAAADLPGGLHASSGFFSLCKFDH